MRKGLMISILGLALVGLSPASAEKPNVDRDMMRELGYGGLRGAKLQKAIEKAEAHPLGSRENPVRENMPEGEVAYLRQLRCPGGVAPQFERSGSVGDSPYGNIMDLYQVTCPGSEPVAIYMDMYHDGGETRPVPGFTFAAN